MESHIVTILDIRQLTHDVLRIRTEKPETYTFIPGQATEVAINQEGWKEERRPFTFTCLPGDNYLEFSIKTYPSHKGVTAHLTELKPGDQLVIHDVWGAIHYEGKGLFIAGGAGITPFISIFRHLKSTNSIAGNRLLFANKTENDIIIRDELDELLGKASVTHVLSDEEVKGYYHGFISEPVIREQLQPGDHIYLCGPPPMMDAIMKILQKIGVAEQSVVMEI